MICHRIKGAKRGQGRALASCSPILNITALSISNEYQVYMSFKKYVSAATLLLLTFTLQGCFYWMIKDMANDGTESAEERYGMTRAEIDSASDRREYIREKLSPQFVVFGNTGKARESVGLPSANSSSWDGFASATVKWDRHGPMIQLDFSRKDGFSFSGYSYAYFISNTDSIHVNVEHMKERMVRKKYLEGLWYSERKLVLLDDGDPARLIEQSPNKLLYGGHMFRVSDTLYNQLSRLQEVKPWNPTVDSTAYD